MRIHLIAAVVLALPLVLRAEPAEAILTRMDAAAPSFHALSAKVNMDTFTAILSDHLVEAGTLRMQRLKKNDVRAIVEFTGTDPRTLAVLGNTVEIYYPKLDQYTKANVGSNKNQLNAFLLLGFGSSGKELAAAYTISAQGEEQIGGQHTTKLRLEPKDRSMAKQLSKVDIWVPEGAAYPVQQQFFQPAQPAENWRKVTYTDVVVNPEMKSNLDLKIPSSAKQKKD